jgi:hypothetical protein
VEDDVMLELVFARFFAFLFESGEFSSEILFSFNSNGGVTGLENFPL